MKYKVSASNASDYQTLKFLLSDSYRNVKCNEEEFYVYIEPFNEKELNHITTLGLKIKIAEVKEVKDSEPAKGFWFLMTMSLFIIGLLVGGILYKNFRIR
jgi:hypothetical protein